jgi:hypothetical protein
MNSKYLLLGILVVFFLILIAYEIKEGFSSKPLAVAAPVREDKTCSDPEMTYLIDRFAKAKLRKPGEQCSEGFTTTYTYPRHVVVTPTNSNDYIVYCLPDCPAGYIENSNDITYCIRTNGSCALSKNLSNSIQDNWGRVCGPLYKANVNLLSTMGSISSVVSTINSQYNAIDTDFTSFSNAITLNASGLGCNAYLRDTIFNVNIISNYYDLTSFNSNTINYWNMLSNEKNKFNGIFNSFNCANYM